MIFRAKYLSEIGWMEIQGDENGIQSLMFKESEPESSAQLPPIFQQLTNELDEYFSFRRKTFDIPLSPLGTDFQKKIWTALQEIPFGKTLSYLEFARKVGEAKAVRADAAAIGRNPIMILVPCHRVIGSDGSLTGYAGGLDRKKFLLELEQGTRTLSLFD